MYGSWAREVTHSSPCRSAPRVRNELPRDRAAWGGQVGEKAQQEHAGAGDCEVILDGPSRSDGASLRSPGSWSK